MKLALCSDEAYPVHRTILEELARLGHEPSCWGAFSGGADVPWATIAERAAQEVASGRCQEGIFLCWSGTGISMAANKIPGIRAALCFEPGGARAARVWNHANVLCLSNRLLSDDMAREILDTWFTTDPGTVGLPGVQLLTEVESRNCGRPKPATFGVTGAEDR